jgi:hypothetical protein
MIANHRAERERNDVWHDTAALSAAAVIGGNAETRQGNVSLATDHGAIEATPPCGLS